MFVVVNCKPEDCVERCYVEVKDNRKLGNFLDECQRNDRKSLVCLE